MSITIDQAFVTAYKSNVYHVSQQMKSRLRDTVNVEPATGEAHAFERLGKATAEQKTTRHSATPQANMAHDRRLAIMSTWGQGETIDTDDKSLALITPESSYVKGLVACMERNFDQRVVNALGGNAASGHDTGSITQVALPTAQEIAHGGTGLTTAKVIQARTKLAKAQAWFRVPPREKFILVGSDMVEDIFTDSADARITSGDYNTKRPLMDGEIMWWMGMNWIEVDDDLLPVDPLDANSRLIYAWIKPALSVGVAKALTSNVGVSPDYRFSTKIYMEEVLGAVRVEDVGVVEISCKVA